MAQAAKAQEPSMEEILASIRRIIADDDPKAEAKPAPAAAAVAAPAPVPSKAPEPVSTGPDLSAMLAEIEEKPAELEIAAEPDILELTEDMAEPDDTAFQTVEPREDIVFAEQAAAEPDFQAALQYPSMPEAPPSPPLMSPATMATVGSAFNSLAHTILTDNARTLEDLVREMMRPMLKAWLDDNLPGLVERIVRAEIERVSRGR